MIWIYYDSKTGNVERFVNRLKQHRDWNIQKIDQVSEPMEAGHLITYTTGFGEIPASTLHFLEAHSSCIKSVSSSGNRNWGPNYAMAASKISAQFDLPVLMQFELSGTGEDIQKFIDNIEAK